MTLLGILPSLRTATPHLDPAVWPHTTRVDSAGRLTIGGVVLNDVADLYGTPAYVLDEADFRRRARRYRKELPGTNVVYAGKALLTTGVARWASEERLGVGVCTGDELATALSAQVDPARIIYHGEAKSREDLRSAVDAGVGRIVVDSLLEVTTLARLARRPQNVLVRVRPGDHVTATVAATVVEPTLRLVGLHCHIGSQVTDAEQYGEAVRRMVVAMADVRRTHRLVLGELNLGGGHGVPTVSGDPELALRVLASFVDDALDAACASERFPRPTIVVEPGRGLSARAGVTLYRVGADGPMDIGEGDCGRCTATLANRLSLRPLRPVSIAGRDAELPADIQAGDLIAMACTGAYHPSMATAVSVRNGRVMPSSGVCQ
jgi:diaminopimelate decarboxylase